MTGDSAKRISLVLAGLLALSVSVILIARRFGSELETKAAAVIPETQSVARVYGYEVVREYPHDPDAFTQGLIYLDGFLYESTGS